MRVLLILPAYNEESNIVRTVESVRSYAHPELEVDYIVINDGSTDNTERVCRHNGIKCISLFQNLGIGGAVQTGYIFALRHNYDAAVQFDGDGQHDISSLYSVVSPLLRDEADFVVGSRFVGEQTDNFRSTALRRVGIRWLSFLSRLFGRVRVKDVTSGYRAANRRALRYLAKNYPYDYPEPESLVSLRRNGFRIREMPAKMLERQGGESSIRAWKSIYYMVKVSFAIVCASMQRKER